MAVSLTKGGNVSLSRTNPNLTAILIGVGWDVRATDGEDFDLDVSCFLVMSTGKVKSDDYFVFYNQLKSPCGSVEHTGDNRTGVGDGDDEALKVDLAKVPADVTRLVVSVTIHDAQNRKQNFGQVNSAFIRIVDLKANIELVRFDLSEDYSTETAMVFGEVYRNGNEWKFKAVGQGFVGGLEPMAKTFGINIG
ncbi:MAG: TerD family protein [Vicinamibacteria bacterium]